MMAIPSGLDTTFVKSDVSLLSIPALAFVPQGIYRIVNVGSAQALTITNASGSPRGGCIPRRGESGKESVPFVSLWSLGANQGAESVHQLWSLTQSARKPKEFSSLPTYDIHSLARAPEPGDQPPPVSPLGPNPFAPSSTSPAANLPKPSTSDQANRAFTLTILPDVKSKITKTAVLPSVAKSLGGDQFPTFPSYRALLDRPIPAQSTPTEVSSNELWNVRPIVAAPRAKQGTTPTELKNVAYKAGKAPNPMLKTSPKPSPTPASKNPLPKAMLAGSGQVTSSRSSRAAVPGTAATSADTANIASDQSSTKAPETTGISLEFVPVPPDHDGPHLLEFYIRIIPPASDVAWLSLTPGSQSSLDFFLGTGFSAMDTPSSFPDGNSVYAMALQSFINQIRNAVKEAKKNKEWVNLGLEDQEWAMLASTMLGWRWRLERAEGWEGIMGAGLKGGSYRFVNEATNLSLSASLTDADTISPLGSTTSRPLDGKSSDFTKVTQTHSNTALDSSMVAHSKTQVWDIVPRVAKNQLSGLPGMFFDVTNNGVPKIKIQPQPDATHSVASPQSSPGWGLLLLTCADTSRESARRYLIHDAQVDGFLGIPTSTGVRSVDTCLGPWKRFAHEKLGEKADTYLGNEWFNGSELLRSMALLNQDEFLENYAHLVWALYEDDLGPADGIYTFSSPSPDQKTFTFLDIPLTQYLEPALLALMPAESRVTGSQWWRITSIMDEKTAEYTYTVVNYRSGHYLEMIDSATAKTKESPEPNIRGTRVVDPKGHSWRFLKTEGGSFQVWNKDNDLCFLWGDHPQAGTATPTCWVITQIFPSFLFGGTYRIINAQNGCDLWMGPKGCRTKKFVETEDATWLIIQLPSTISGDDAQICSIYSSEKAAAGLFNKLAVPSGRQNLDKADQVAAILVTATTNSDTDVLEWKMIPDPKRSLWTIMAGHKSGKQKVLGINPTQISSPTSNDTAVTQEDEQVICGTDIDSLTHRWRLIKVDSVFPPAWNPQSSSPTTATVGSALVIASEASLDPYQNLPRTKSRPSVYLPDGLYRIVNRHSKLLLCLAPDKPGHGLGVQSSAKGSIGLWPGALSYKELKATEIGEVWYITRETAKLAADPSRGGSGDAYVIENYAKPLRLDFGENAAGQKADGSALWVTPRTMDCISQRWRILKQSSFGFKLQSMANGAFLDVGDATQGDAPVVTPQITDLPAATQLWRLEPVRASIDDGIFRISCSDDSRTLIVEGGRVLAGDPTSVTYWRIVATRGVYEIGDLPGTNFLAADATNALCIVPRNQRSGLATKWKLRLNDSEDHATSMIRRGPSGIPILRPQTKKPGSVYTFENISAALNLSFSPTLSLAPSNVSGQGIQLSRVSKDTPFSTLPSSNVVYGGYQITNVGSKGYLTSSEATRKVYTNDYAFVVHWQIVPSGTGAFAITIVLDSNGRFFSLSSNLALNDGSVCIGPDGFTASRWKLVPTDLPYVFRMVNCDSGLFLTDCGSGVTATASDDGGTASQMWRLSLSSPFDKGRPLPSLAREATVNNGMYSILTSSDSTVSRDSLALVCSNGATSPSVSPRDLGAFSLKFAQEVWLIEQDIYGWFIIKHMIHGWALGLGSQVSGASPSITPGSALRAALPVSNPKSGIANAEYSATTAFTLGLGSPNRTPNFQWKFLTIPGTSGLRLANRLRTDLALTFSSSPIGVSMKMPQGNQSCTSWNLSRISGSPADVYLQAGVYIMSTFQPVTKSALAKNMNTAKGKIAASASVETDISRIEINYINTYKYFMDTFTIAVAEFGSRIGDTAILRSHSYQQYNAGAFSKSELEDTFMDIDDRHGKYVYTLAVAYFAMLVDRKGELTNIPADPIKIQNGNMQVSTSLTDWVSWRMKNAHSDFEIDSRISKMFSNITSMPALSKEQRQDNSVAQNLVRDTGFAIMASLHKLWRSLAPEDPTTDTTNTKDVLTAKGPSDYSLYSTNLISQNIEQLWAFEPVHGRPGVFTIGSIDKSACLGLMSDATGDAHDTRKDALVMIRPPAWLGSFLTSFYWFPVRQGDNSWIIHNVRSPNKVLSFAFGFNARLKCSSVLKDSMAGARRERWALRRSGYYIQSKRLDIGPFVLKATSGKRVVLADFAPFAQAWSSGDAFQSPFSPNPRLDALYIWHLVKTGSEFRLINEASGTNLCVGPARLIYVSDTLQARDEDLMKLMKDTSGLYLAIGILRGRARDGKDAWSSFVGMQGMLFDQDDSVVARSIAKEASSTWDLISVGNIERGGPLSLPRVVLSARTNRYDRSHVLEPNPSEMFADFKPYKSDDSLQRFRRIDVAGCSAFVHERTNRLLQCHWAQGNRIPSPLTLQAPDEKLGFTTTTHDCWFKVDPQGHLLQLSAPYGGLLVHWNIPHPSWEDTGIQVSGSNTGDLPTSTTMFRIQIGQDINAPPVVLSGPKTGGVPTITDLNLQDNNQLWTYLEWENGRYIQHLNTGQLIHCAIPTSTVPSEQHRQEFLVTMMNPANATMYSLWQLETPQVCAASAAAAGDKQYNPIAGKDGFYRLFIPSSSRDAKSPPFSLQPFVNMIPLSGYVAMTLNGQYGCRFIAPAKSLRFTWRSAMLLNFLKTKMPVFVHAAAKEAKPSMIVAAPVDAAVYLPAFANGHRRSEEILTNTTASKVPKAYVTVRPASEPIYYNYTDFTICVLYAQNRFHGAIQGWRHLTMRFNNDDNTLSSVRFPDHAGWVPNIDQSFTTLGDIDQNPLKIIKRPTPSGPVMTPTNAGTTSADVTSSVTKLHVYVDENLVFRPDFPAALSNDVIAQRQNSPDLYHWDSGACAVLVEADCLQDDGTGTAPVRLPFMDLSLPEWEKPMAWKDNWD